MLKHFRAASILVLILIAIVSVAMLGACEDEPSDSGVRLVDVKVDSGFLGHDLVGYVENLTQSTVRNVTISMHYYEGESDLPENYKELGTCQIYVTVHPQTKEPFTCGLDRWRDEFHVVYEIVDYEGAASASPAQDTDLEKGKNALSRGEYADAYNILRPLAEQGNADAQVTVGSMYERGRGVTQDYAEAAKWYRMAAEQGHAFGQALLATIYEDGQGVPLDYVQAHMWFNLAAAREPPGKNRDAAVWLRENVEGNMTPEQIAEAQRLAREWKPK